MALYKYHYIELDTKRSPRISLQNIVAGETGNRIWITVTNNGETVDMSEKENGEFIYRVCLKIDSDLGTRRQDSAQANSGITFIEAATGDHGKINILLSKDSFTVGMNRCRIEIFSKRAADNDTLICSAEWTFRAAGNPTGENAGSVYPSLIELENELNQLIDDAEDAIEDCEDATEAANDAAEAANAAAAACPFVLHVTDVTWDGSELSSIEFEETAEQIYTVLASGRAIEFGVNTTHEENGIIIYERHYVREQNRCIEGESAPYRIEVSLRDEDEYGNYCQILLAATGNDIACDGDFGVKDLAVDTAPTQGSNHPVTSGGVYTALQAKQNTLTFDDDPTQNSNNPVKSGGVWYALEQKQGILVLDNAPTHGSDHFVNSGTVRDAIDTAAASASKKNVFLVKHDATWSDSVAQGNTEYYGDDLLSISDDAVFAAQIALPTGEIVTLYERNRDSDSNDYFLKSDVIDGKYVTATMSASDSHVAGQITFYLKADESPLMLHIVSTEEYTAGGKTYRRVNFASGETDKIYAYRNTRDMYVEMTAWDSVGMTDKLCLRKSQVVADEHGNVFVDFDCVLPGGNPHSYQEMTSTYMYDYRIRVFYVNEVFYAAQASLEETNIIPTSASVSNGRVTFKDANNSTAFYFDLPLYNGGVQ